MTYEARSNGTHAIMCDEDDCDHELIAPSQEDVFGDANLAGWSSDGAGENEKHACTGCMRQARSPQAMLQQMLGTQTPSIIAPMQVRKGDPAHTPDGQLIGHYAEDGNQGDEVPVKIEIPEMSEEPKPGAGVHAKHDDMMEGVDDDDDAQRAYRSAVAPAVAPAGDPARGVDVPPVSYLADANVAVADLPEAFTPDAQARARAVGINLDGDPFHGISWDPDDD